MATEFKIKRIDDKSLHALFKAAKEAGETALKEEQAKKGTLQGSGQEIRITYSSSLPWKMTERDFEEAPVGQFVLTTATIVFVSKATDRNQPREEQVSFSFKRGGNDTLVDSFTLTNSNQIAVMNSEGEQAVQRAIHKALSPLLQPIAPEDGGLIPTLSNLSEAFSTTYQQISTELSNAVTAVSQERADQITEFQEERKLLKQEIATERSALQENMRQELDESRADLEAKRLKLEEEWGKLEVSSHKDARRKQFLTIQDDLQKALSAPVADKNLQLTRWAIFVALVAAGGIAGFLAYGSITVGTTLESSELNGNWVFPAIRSFVLTAVSLTAFLGAAAWLRYFYVRDLQAQEELRRFRNDMARASWVMEAALEIRKEHNETIPPEWITGVTEGLFAAQNKESLKEGSQALVFCT